MRIRNLIILVICVWFPGYFLPANGYAGENKLITFVHFQSSENSTSKWANLIYQEAFRRLNLEFQLKIFPAKRCSYLANHGIVDGEVSRIYDYGKSFINLVRVESSIYSVKIMAYSGNPSIRVNGWDSLMATNYKVSYLFGVKINREKLGSVVASGNLFYFYSLKQGIKNITEGVVDIFVAGEMPMLSELLRVDSGVRERVFTSGLLQEITLYPYLHKKHENLAVDLSKTIEQMRQEGLIDVFKEKMLE